jgi:hypothetical protein
MKHTLALTVLDTITVAEVADLIREIESITDTDDGDPLVTVAGLVAVDGQPVKKLIPRTLKDFIKETTSHGDPS